MPDPLPAPASDGVTATATASAGAGDGDGAGGGGGSGAPDARAAGSSPRASHVRRAVSTVATGLRTDSRRGDAYNAVGMFVIGVLLLLVDVVQVWSIPPLVTVDGRWWHVLPLLAGCVALVFKRAHPAVALSVGTVAFAVDLSFGGSLGMVLVLWDLLYASGLHGSRRLRTVVGVAVGVLVVAVAVLTGEHYRDVQGFVVGGIQVAAILATPLWWAANVRQKSDLADLAAERADLEAERADLEAQRAADLEQIATLGQHEAVRAERAAMARDLHDVIASHLSAIAIHSGAALASPPDAARDRAALELVRSSSITSLEEMRAMILLLRSDLPREGAPRAGASGVDQLSERGRGMDRLSSDNLSPDSGPPDLRDGVPLAPADQLSERGRGMDRLSSDNRATVLGGEAVAAPARLARLDDVLVSARAQGLTVDVEDPEGARSATLPAAVDQAAHRIVQEALTNAAKHAPGGRVLVTLGLGPDRLTVEVTSSLTDEPRPLPPSLSTRTGLLTMRERAEALGGTFRAGPVDARDSGPRAARGAWHVRAVLPLGRPAGPPTATTATDQLSEAGRGIDRPSSDNSSADGISPTPHGRSAPRHTDPPGDPA
ncbi:histidine kinase [Oerskovia sp. Root22]|uniref:ATP-binding protein n=1 Tax=Oerskovia sp. Root22 TaxID=1736494 RepID=UPI000A6DAAB2|nr:histidine kinase [Oerskovia sp. Root22]